MEFDDLSPEVAFIPRDDFEHKKRLYRAEEMAKLQGRPKGEKILKPWSMNWVFVSQGYLLYRHLG